MASEDSATVIGVQNRIQSPELLFWGTESAGGVFHLDYGLYQVHGCLEAELTVL